MTRPADMANPTAHVQPCPAMSNHVQTCPDMSRHLSSHVQPCPDMSRHVQTPVTITTVGWPNRSTMLRISVNTNPTLGAEVNVWHMAALRSTRRSHADSPGVSKTAQLALGSSGNIQLPSYNQASIGAVTPWMTASVPAASTIHHPACRRDHP